MHYVKFSVDGGHSTLHQFADIGFALCYKYEMEKLHNVRVEYLGKMSIEDVLTLFGDGVACVNGEYLHRDAHGGIHVYKYDNDECEWRATYWIE